MAANEEVSTSELFEAQTHIIALTMSHINSLSLKTAIELGVFEAIPHHGKPMTLSELATAIRSNPEKAHGLYCLVRIVVRSGLLSAIQEEEEETVYMLTPTSQLLLKDETNNVLPFVLESSTDPVPKKFWDYLGNWLVNDDATLCHTFNGKSFYENTALDPECGSSFNELTASDSRLVAKALTQKECSSGVFGGLTSLVDVGGGTGTLAKAIARTFPNLKCTVFDVPQVVAGLQGSGNLDFVGGDMFDSIP